MVNVLTGGMKLITVLKVELGSRPIGWARIHGAISVSMIGIISDCASFISLTAAPTATIRDAFTT